MRSMKMMMTRIGLRSEASNYWSFWKHGTTWNLVQKFKMAVLDKDNKKSSSGKSLGAEDTMAGKDVAKVVNQCDAAKESNILDLCRCELTQVPDAIFLLLRSTPLVSCDLSENLLKKVPPKLARNFTSVTDLNLDCNHLSQLPDELRQMEQLTTLNISHNRFSSLPPVVYELKSLKILKAEGNGIKEVDVQQLRQLPNLTDVNLKDNPLNHDCYTSLMNLFEFEVLKIALSPQDPEFDSVD